MITPKGTLGRTSWRENGSWSDVRVSEEASSWNAFVSSDACGQPAFADGGFYVSPGEWNVYVSKAAVDVKGASTSRRGPPIHPSGPRGAERRGLSASFPVISRGFRTEGAARRCRSSGRKIP